MIDIELLHIITMPTRYRLLMLLLKHHYCGKALAVKLGISESAVSQHLQILKDCGLVTGKRIDHQMHYQVDTNLLMQTVHVFYQKVSENSDHLLPGNDCDCEYAKFCSRRRKGEKS